MIIEETIRVREPNIFEQLKDQYEGLRNYTTEVNSNFVNHVIWTGSQKVYEVPKWSIDVSKLI